LDGSYVVAWDGTGTRDGVPADDLYKARNGWVFQSDCGVDGCVATGGSIVDTANPTAPLKNLRVADYADGRWSMVYVSAGAASCVGASGQKYTADVWTSWDIAVAPDKSLATTVTTMSTDECASVDVMSPTMTRSGDPLPGFPLPDPAGQPPIEPAPASAFHGQYTVTLAPRDRPDGKATVTVEVATSCLREGDRCVTSAISEEPAEPGSPFARATVYEFADGVFTRAYDAGGQPCPGGGEGSAVVTERLTLPPAQTSDPLRVLSGERVTTYAGGCQGSFTSDVEYALSAQ
jgi:hypothetical protein